ncbi:NfeD family protein [Desulfovibrio sp. OttesenSCG-928-M14]|nr:NfeD family protein [Desulfovibrio sp. OttesenSCG-928-M14]
MPELLRNVDAYWLWLALACLLLSVEVLIVPSGFFLCLGSAAAVTALALFFFPDLSWLWALSLYATLSVLSIWFWWAVLRRRRAARQDEENEHLNLKTRQLLGYQAVLDEDIKGGRGRIRVNDSAWPVQADKDYPAGTLVRVTEVQGITLLIESVTQAPAAQSPAEGEGQ